MPVYNINTAGSSKAAVFTKITSVVQLYELLPDNERIIVDVLRQLISGTLPSYCKEKLSFNVPYFYGKKGICIVWPSTIPRGGIKKGVLLGFWHGNKLKDKNGYLTLGTNKQVFYKIFQNPEEIDQEEIVRLLREAVKIDKQS
jgi:hypothetical protein